LSTLTPQARSHGHANALLVSVTRQEKKGPTGSLLGTRQENTGDRGGFFNARRRGNCVPASTSIREHRIDHSQQGWR
jgi:hypothetical protein